MSNASSTARTKLTPPQLAARWGVSADKILAFIKAGELRAFNAARKANGRPRWLIDVVDVELFEQRRAAASTPPAKTRKKRAAGTVIEFF